MKTPPKNPHKAPPDRDILRRLYIDENLRLKDIGAFFGRDESNIYWWLKKYGIHLELSPHERRHRNDASAGVRGAKHHNWKGGRWVNKFGYVMLLAPGHPNANAGGYVQEHRKVMADHVGRPIAKQEVIHHKNGDKTDNRIENLVLYSSHSEHLKSGHPNLCASRRKLDADEWRHVHRARSEKARAIREALKIYVQKHNVSRWYLSREVTFPKAARLLLQKDILLGRFESPPSSYLERASADPAQPILQSP